ncbi:UbiA family prenyltransferase [Halorarum salinum]|uniref:UbiA family prenyltransferase n=1 Tax=Halorarum salinum TaxID=2743089 RepID=UPI001FEBE6F2|nr:UbiA family prenyltransferase [Halobaculum salinum]
MATARLTGSPADYAALVRVPNVFTAPPDVLAGAALAVAAGATGGPASGTLADVAAAAVASTFVYAAGTALNDYFDAPRDAVERPERPIPSGRVERSTAFGLGMASLAAGVLVALLAGVAAAVVAGLLVAVVLSYDGALKDGSAGPPTMGAARGLNVALGAAAVGVPGAASEFGAAGATPAVAGLPAPLVAAPVAVALYIAGVTAMAETETVGGDRRLVAVAATGAALAATAALLVAVAAGAPAARTGLAALLAAAFLVAVGRPLRRAYADPVPGTVGPAVGSCVLGLVVLDAAFAATAGVGWALVTLGFLVPAVGLSRVFDVT